MPEGATWHPATDGLQGTDVYGNENDLTQPFSKKFDDLEFNQVRIHVFDNDVYS